LLNNKIKDIEGLLLDQEGKRLVEACLRDWQLLWKIIMRAVGQYVYVSKLVQELTIELSL
jgi:hypothetical protein